MHSDTWAIALHEAGHGLMAYLCGGSAWIERKSSGGRCGARLAEGCGDEFFCVAHMLIDASGLAAEALLADYDPGAIAAAADDRADFFLGCRTLKSMGSSLVFGEDASWRLYLQVAKSLLRPHVHILHDLAQQADHRGYLDRGTVEGRLLWWKLSPVLSGEDWKDVLLTTMDQALYALEEGS
jgi:hypothetical protein